MLKRYTFIIIALLLAISCREKDNGKNTPEEFSATLSLRDSGSGFQWKADARIQAVAVGSGSSASAALENKIAGENALFSGEINAKEGDYTVYAVSPASAYVSAISGAKVKMTVPADQHPLENGPDPAADFIASAPCSVTIEDGEAQGTTSFSRITSIVKVVPSGFPAERVKSVSLDFGAQEIAGNVSVDLSQKKTGGFVGVGAKKVTASFSESFVMNGTNGAYISIVPATLSAGASIVVTVNTDSRKYSKTLTVGSGVPGAFEAGQTVSISCPLTEDDAANETSLRVMSFNIKAGYDSETGEHCWSNRKVGQKMMMADIDPDIVALQEVDAPQRNYYASDITGYTYVTVTTGAQSGADYKKCGCNQIGFRTSRFTLVDKGWYWLSETPDVESKGYEYDGYLSAIYARLQDNVSGVKILVVSTHIASGNNNPSREFTSRLVVERTKALVTDDDVVFVMGDMNAANYTKNDINGYPGYRQSIQAFYDWMTDSRSVAKQKVNDYSLNGYGAWTKHATLNIDMIFYRNVKSADCFTTVTKPYNNTEYISDHYPVVLDCKY